MCLDPRVASRQELGSLESCLVGGDPEQIQRERRLRRRALALSVILEGAVLAALVLMPLFGRPVGIARSSMPLPPYYRRSPSRPEPTASTPVEARRRAVCVTCFFRPPAPLRDLHGQNEAIEPPAPPGSADSANSLPCPSCIEFPGAQGARPAPPPLGSSPDKTRIHTQLDPAMLVHRVEPVYPVLAKQMGRSGRVELRAVIATDGTMQSLQVVGGDALFYQSALDAVGQWRYRPTVLNGQPVEVDTYITVIYHADR